MKKNLVLVEQVTPGITRITLNDPERLNAMSEEMAEEFRRVTDGLRENSSTLRALILTGAGKAFSAGGDLAMLEKKAELGGEENRRRMMGFYHSFLGILDVGVPIVAAINGAAIGAGLCLASACDIRIASSNAKLGFTFAKIGLHPGMGATYFLPRVVGQGSAAELLLTGRVIDAAEALRRGLLSQVVSPEEIRVQSERIAGEIADCGPEAIRQLVVSLRGGPSSQSAALEREACCQSINYASVEFREGVRATIEKRKPRFSSGPQ